MEGGITAKDERQVVIPRDKKDDYSEEAIKTRQKFVENYTDKKLEHITILLKPLELLYNLGLILKPVENLILRFPYHQAFYEQCL